MSGVTNIMSDASSDEATQHIRPFLGSYRLYLVVDGSYSSGIGLV